MEKNDARGVLKFNESFTDEEYKASKCLSYSIIKDVPDNPEVLITPREEKKEEWFTFGTVVDMLLTESAADIDERIVVNDVIPSDQYKKISDYIIENNLDIDNLTDLQIEEVYVNSGSAVNWKTETKKQKMLENCKSYVDLLTKNKDKLIITTEMFNEATKVAMVFTTHKWTRNLFAPGLEQVHRNFEILYQFKIKYAYKDLLCKSKIDILFIDHNKKVIMPIDVKTGTDTWRQFVRSAIYKYRYCYQAVLYKEGLKSFVNKIKEFKDYEIDDFRFVYVNRLKPIYPVVVKIDEVLHEEIKIMGIHNDLYDLLSLNEIMTDIAAYMKDIDEGKTTFDPFELRETNGEYVIEPTTKYF